jgi:poly(3-hydroxybutyrate) depolymerase
VFAARLAAPAVAAVAFAVVPAPVAAPQPLDVRAVTVAYRSHSGAVRQAVVLVPKSYGGEPLPLVISPHGRGATGSANAALWGTLPSVGRFAVVNPDGDGRRLGRFSWGAAGQIDDLARMPDIVERALPWLRIDRARVFAFGGSMGGQETLLLVARHPHVLAGAAAFDSLVDFAHQYDQFPRLRCKAPCRAWGGSLGGTLQRLARREVGGTPATAARAYAARSPLAHARQIARSGVPLQVWWSRADRIVVDADLQSGALLDAVRAEGPAAPVLSVEGTWAHTHELRYDALLPYALARFGLLPSRYDRMPRVTGMRVVHRRLLG